MQTVFLCLDLGAEVLNQFFYEYVPDAMDLFRSSRYAPRRFTVRLSNFQTVRHKNGQ